MPLDLTHLTADPSDPRALRTGTVKSHDAPTMRTRVVVDDGAELVLPCARGLSPAAGDAALLGRARHGLYVLALLGPAPQTPPPTVPDPDVPDPVIVSVALAPTVTGSARGGAWRGDTDKPTQGDWTGRGVQTGAAFYRRPPAGTVLAASVRVRRADGGVFAAVAPTLHLWAQSGPAGTLTSRASMAGPALRIGQDVSVALPASWGQELVAGTAGGIGLRVAGASPYVVTHGRSTWSPAWTLTLRIQT